VSRRQDLELLAGIVDAVRASHELTQALSRTRDDARAGCDLSADLGRCVEIATRLLDATRQLQELAGTEGNGH